MSYQVLARKWRPQTFAGVVGQEHVTRALCNAIRLGRLHHAYLFSGTRGVGKTTLTRILAAALNCETGIVEEPCGKCQSCTAIRSGRFIDLIEVDAASRSGVEDMRDLLDTVQYSPASARFKIYLVDEVHMLSTSSFNALLKTLEEPPDHAKFFFATTDPQKIPPTVLSRCLQFNLSRLSHGRIADYLANMLTAEDIRHENEALLELAVAADGSMRDALSLLDQALAYGAGELNQEAVKNILGITFRESIPKLLRALVAGDSQAIFSEIAEMHQGATDFSVALDDLLHLLHELAVQQVLPEATPSHRFPPKEIASLSRSVSANDVQLYYQVAVKSRKDMHFLSDQRSVFEMALLRMLCFRPLFAAVPVPAAVSVPAGSQQASSAVHTEVKATASRRHRAAAPVAAAAAVPERRQAASSGTSGDQASTRQEGDKETNDEIRSLKSKDATASSGTSGDQASTRQEGDKETNDGIRSLKSKDAAASLGTSGGSASMRQEGDKETNDEIRSLKSKDAAASSETSGDSASMRRGSDKETNDEIRSLKSKDAAASSETSGDSASMHQKGDKETSAEVRSLAAKDAAASTQDQSPRSRPSRPTPPSMSLTPPMWQGSNKETRDGSRSPAAKDVAASSGTSGDQASMWQGSDKETSAEVRPLKPKDAAASSETSGDQASMRQGSDKETSAEVRPLKSKDAAASSGTSGDPASMHQGSDKETSDGFRSLKSKDAAVSTGTSGAPASMRQGSDKETRDGSRSPAAKDAAASSETSGDQASMWQGSDKETSAEVRPLKSKDAAVSSGTSGDPASMHQGSDKETSDGIGSPAAKDAAASSETSGDLASMRYGSDKETSDGIRSSVVKDAAASSQDQNLTSQPTPPNPPSPPSMSLMPPMHQKGDKETSAEVRPLVAKDAKDWKTFADEMSLNKGARELCRNSTLRVRNKDEAVVVVGEESRGLARDRIFGQVRAALQKRHGSSLKVDLQVSDECGETPEQGEQLELGKQRELLRDDVMKHPLVETLRRDFGATVVESSIRKHNVEKPKTPDA